MTTKLPTPRSRDEGLALIEAAVHEARAVLQPWECDGLAALITQFARWTTRPRNGGPLFIVASSAKTAVEWAMYNREALGIIRREQIVPVVNLRDAERRLRGRHGQPLYVLTDCCEASDVLRLAEAVGMRIIESRCDERLVR